MLRFLNLSLVAAACSLLLACSDAPAPASMAALAPVKVVVEPLRFEHARTRIEAVGTSRAARSVDVFSVTAGEVVAINFEPGEIVTAGQVLVELDRREEELAVRLARLQLADAERLFDRYQRSAGSGAVLPTVVDAARTAVEAGRLELERAEIALTDRTIVATFTGHVGSTEVDRGDRINSNTMITTLDDRRSLLVTFEVPEAFIGELAVGEFVQLETWSANRSMPAGQVIDIGSRIDPRKRTFIARASVENIKDAMRPGMSFRVAVDVAGDLFPSIAETGLQWGADGAYVWLVQDGRAARVPVKVVQRREGRVLIDAGQLDGELVVVEGTQRMRDGVDVSYELPGLARQDASTTVVNAAYIRSIPGAD